MADVYVLSRVQALGLREARASGAASVSVSLDLGLSASEVAVEEGGARLPDGSLLPWEEVAAICEAERQCFAVQAGAATVIRRFSETTGRLCALMPTSGAPTLLIAGIPMHRCKDVDPWADTANKMRAIGRLHGRVLDTCTGLGYTAIAAARTAEEVVTIEIDPAVLDVARLNPWSRPLFALPGIEQRIGDVFEVVEEFPDAHFAAIIHDPPAMRLAGDLYAAEMYRRLARILREGGRLFHYIGDPDSKSGRSVTRGVAQRLQEAGFVDVRARPEAFGLVARKAGGRHAGRGGR